MLRRKLMGDLMEESKKDKRLKTKIENPEIIPVTSSGDISPYFKNDNQNYLQQGLSNYHLQSIKVTEHLQAISDDPVRSKCEHFQEKLNTHYLPTLEDKMLILQVELNHSLRSINLKIPPVEYIYNPLEYAFDAYKIYILKYCSSIKKIAFVGMNPGPFGMCQTGVPFGDPKCVKEFLQIEGVVNKPEIECPFREILGFNSSRREQSGERLWRFFQSICHTPEFFFKNAFLFNFCPIALMKGNGCNVTPGEIKDIKVRKSLEVLCEDWYLKVIRLLQPEYLIAIGRYIHKKTKDVFKANHIDNIKILYMPHPSPRAVNNTNWHEKAQTFLDENNLMQYFRD